MIVPGIPLLIWIIVSLASCATSQRGGTGPLPINGMVYDFANQPVRNAKLSIGGSEVAETDINGRFSLLEAPSGDFELVATHEGFETTSQVVNFDNPVQILYFKLLSDEHLIELAREQIAERHWVEALGFLERAERINAHDYRSSYLRAIILFRSGDVPGAKSILDALLADGRKDPYVYLFLADIYQYRLDNPGVTAANLKLYLQLRADPDVEKRLQGLVGQK